MGQSQVKSHPAKLACSTLQAHRVTSASGRGSAFCPLPCKGLLGSLVITLVFAVSHEKNKTPPSNSKMMIKALGKPARVSREENNQVPPILAHQTGRTALWRVRAESWWLLDARLAAQAPCWSCLPPGRAPATSRNWITLGDQAENRKEG